MDFVLLDNFYDSGTVATDGTGDGRTRQRLHGEVGADQLRGRGFTYDWEGANRNVNVGLPGLAERRTEDPSYPNDPNLLAGVGDVAAPDAPDGEAGAGYLWDSALRAGKTIRNYGFYVANLPTPTTSFRSPFAQGIPQAVPLKPALAAATDVYFRGYDQTNADFWLFKAWEREFDALCLDGRLPNLSFVRLPHDHFGNFSTASHGVTTLETEMADHDYAVVRLVEGWPTANNTLIFVVEDDAQNGGDRGRSPQHRAGRRLFVGRGAVVSKHYTTVSIIRSIADALGWSPGPERRAGEPMAETYTRPQP